MNHWYVITGAPSSGKTTTLAALQQRGYRVLPEMARVVIDEGVTAGLTAAEIRADEEQFQSEVLARKQALEAELPADQAIFFDRGMHDTLAYLRLRGFAETEAQAASKAAHYHRVFLLERLPWTPDYARTENAVQAERLDNLLEATYREHGYTVIRIPVGSVDERAAEILAAL